MSVKEPPRTDSTILRNSRKFTFKSISKFWARDQNLPTRPNPNTLILYLKNFYRIMTAAGERQTACANLKSGSIVKVTKGRRIPADMILLWTSDPSGTIFLKTDQLDGETDWKVRESIKHTQTMIDLNIETLWASNCCIQAMEPSQKIYEFNGTFFKEPYSDDFEGLRLKHTLWANTTVASGEAIGLVVYTGKESRMQMNISKPSTKFGKIDYEINFLSKLLFIFSVTMSCLLLF
jgi:phospholipid-translocating ATPase